MRGNSSGNTVCPSGGKRPQWAWLADIRPGRRLP